jgi:hypothetical protein
LVVIHKVSISAAGTARHQGKQSTYRQVHGPGGYKIIWASQVFTTVYFVGSGHHAGVHRGHRGHVVPYLTPNTWVYV